jgi:hypothetical protein
MNHLNDDEPPAEFWALFKQNIDASNIVVQQRREQDKRL